MECCEDWRAMTGSSPADLLTPTFLPFQTCSMSCLESVAVYVYERIQMDMYVCEWI